MADPGSGLRGAALLDAELVDALDAALPQTQCTRCGEPDCRRYAEALAAGRVPPNRCPPGGQAGADRLAQLLGLPARPLDPQFGVEAERGVARIVERDCIGCTLCIKACPVDAIVGAPKHMHSVIEADCTGCELCIPACPVDCIELPSVTPGQSGWAAWSPAQAQVAKTRYSAHQQRTLTARQPGHPLEAAAAAAADAAKDAASPSSAAPSKQSVVAAALARARARAATT